MQKVTLSLHKGKSALDVQEFCLEGGVARPAVHDEEADSAGEPSEDREPENDSEIADRVITKHVDSLSEVMFPSSTPPRRVPRAEGLFIVDWSEFDKCFWAHDDEAGPMHLIVRIAIECTQFLEEVCRRPRRMLRRERIEERLDRIQQMDDACIRWFVRQPGRTILEKAGPRQRVLGVVRIDTTNTLENRVVRDFLERCGIECREYVRRNKSYPKAARVQAVRKFRNRVQQWLRTSEIGTLPRMASITQPNYVLQFDERYSKIWQWYERLCRQQAYQDGLWRWQHRTWAEHVAFAFLHAFSEVQGNRGRFRGDVYLRPDQTTGQFLDPRSPSCTWAVELDGTLLVEAYSRSQLIEQAAIRPSIGPLASLGPDLVLLARRPFDSDDFGRVLALWCSIRTPEAGFRSNFDSWLKELLRAAGRRLDWDRVTPALAMPLGEKAPPIRLMKSVSGAYGIGLALPVPVHPHLPWLTSQLRDWIAEGVL
jgi:hypothetical protein